MGGWEGGVRDGRDGLEGCDEKRKIKMGGGRACFMH